MAVWELLISDVDYSTYTDVTSISINDSTESGGDSMNFTLNLSAAQMVSEPGRPNSGQIVSIRIDGVKQYEGVILQCSQQLKITKQLYVVQCQASGYAYIFSSKLVTIKDFPEQLAGNAVRTLVQQYAPGFGTRYVMDGFVVPKTDFDHQSLGAILDSYAQAIGYSWYIDFDREVHFSAGESITAPISVVDLDADRHLGDISIEANTTQLKNKLYIKDATSRAAEKRTDTFISDGQQSFFRLFSPPFDAEGAEVKVNGSSIAVFEDTLTNQEGEIDGGSGLSFLCVLNQGLRFPISDIPDAGDVVTVDYYPEEGGGDGGIVIVMEDPDSIRMMRQRESFSGLPSDGIHEGLVSVPEMRVRTLDPLSFLGGIVLDQAAWPEITGAFTNIDAEVRGWRAGMAFTMTSALQSLFNDKQFWRTGQKGALVLYVKQVNKSFVIYRKEDHTLDLLWKETVNFTSVPARRII